jgi:hypothetical protein
LVDLDLGAAHAKAGLGAEKRVGLKRDKGDSGVLEFQDESAPCR